MKTIRSSETSVLIKATRLIIPEDDILHSHRGEYLRSYSSIHPFIYLSVYHLYIYPCLIHHLLSIYLSIYLSLIYLSIYLFSLSVYDGYWVHGSILNICILKNLDKCNITLVKLGK
jgi:hypothetical protein